MTQGVNDLINAIASGDSIAIETAFNTEMATRISERLDDMRVDVARNMFATESVSVDEEVEELDEVSLDKASGAYAARVDKLNKSKFGTNKFDDNNMKASDTLDRIAKKHGDAGKKAAVKKAGGHDVSEDVL